MTLVEAWEDALTAFFVWRHERFPRFYARRARRRFEKDMREKFGFVPGVGSWVEDCRPVVGRITEVDPDDPDSVALDGHWCSLWHCCSPARDPGGW